MYGRPVPPRVVELLLVGLLVAIFVGYNIGGSSTGVAFGPAVGSGAVSKLTAGALMTVFALLGGWTLGRRVVDTLGSGIVVGDPFTLPASIAVLFFIGFSLFVSNLYGVPASTSMTAVGAIAGLGLARGTLNADAMFEIISWWLVAPVVGFWVSAVVGRYWYEQLSERVAIDRTDGPTVVLSDGGFPRLRLGPGTTRREFAGTALVVVIGCYMAFSAGASNIANAVAPLVGSGRLGMNPGILLAAGAMGIGAFTIGRRTLRTMGSGLTELPLVAALVVAVVSSTLVTLLSAIGIPASFVVIATMSTIGLGWGRATRTEADAVAAVGGVAHEETAPVGSDDPADVASLYRPATTARVVLLQNTVPAVATAASYAVFAHAPFL